MRARNIKPGIFKNEVLGQADPIYTIIFEGLWCIADREGRLEDRPTRIEGEIFPYRDFSDFNGELTQLERWGFIQRYEVDGVRLIQVVNFLKHQSPHHTEKKSVLPPPNNGNKGVKKINGEPTVNPPLLNGEYPPDSLIPDSLIQRTPPLTPPWGVEPLGLKVEEGKPKRVKKQPAKEKPAGPSVNDLLGGKDTPASVTFWKAVGTWAKNRTQRLKDAAVLWRQHVDGGIAPESLLVAVRRCMDNFSQDEVNTGKVIRFDTWLEQEGFRTWLPKEPPVAARPKAPEDEVESGLYRSYLESNAMLRGVTFQAFKAARAGEVAP